MASHPDQVQAGPTGEFPEGKVSPHDEGQLCIKVLGDPETRYVYIDLGVPVRTVAMTGSEAMAFARSIQHQASKVLPMKEEKDN